MLLQISHQGVAHRGRQRRERMAVIRVVHADAQRRAALRRFDHRATTARSAGNAPPRSSRRSRASRSSSAIANTRSISRDPDPAAVLDADAASPAPRGRSAASELQEQRHLPVAAVRDQRIVGLQLVLRSRRARRCARCAASPAPGSCTVERSSKNQVVFGPTASVRALLVREHPARKPARSRAYCSRVIRSGVQLMHASHRHRP